MADGFEEERPLRRLIIISWLPGSTLEIDFEPPDWPNWEAIALLEQAIETLKEDELASLIENEDDEED